AYLSSGFMKGMDDDVRGEIAEHGIRNALLTSIAPTGTISLYAGNVSSGIEPVFAYSYKRKVLQPDGSKIEEEVVDYAVKLWRDKFGDTPFPDYFVSAQTLSPQEHIRMQAAAQRWIDSSISKTINCPEDISIEDFQDVYMQAWEQGCKGCTTYRPNAVTGSVLTVSEEKKDAPAAPVERASQALAVAMPSGNLIARDPVLEGKTYKIKWPSAAHAYYLTVNDIVLEDGSRAPFEVFINTQNTHDTDMLSALTRMISAIFRRGGDIGFVAEELRQIMNPQGGGWVDGQYVPSLPSMIGLRLFQHMEAIGAVAPGVAAPVEVNPTPEAMATAPALRGPACPSCGDHAMIRESGCDKCLSCGHSKCS
ncbi:MAG: ribonucleotide reductase, partial [Rhodobacterales bacterium 34-62-10]